MARPGVAAAFKRIRSASVQRAGSTRGLVLGAPKFGGGGSGPTFGPIPFGPTPTGGNPFAPTGGGGGVPGGGGGGGSPLDGLCDLIPAGFLREACKAGSAFIPIPGGGGGGGGGNGSGGVPGPCPDGTFRVGDRCVSPGDMFPGGDPGTFPAGGNTVPGGFGMPAVTPTMEQRTVHACPTGFVLGKDNLCYPKQLLSRRSRFRKWKGDPRPPVTAADAKAIRRADRVRDRVKSLGKDVGLKVTNR